MRLGRACAQMAWILRIAGPDEAGHQKQVERAVSAAGLGEVVSFTGPIEPHMKKSAFLDADLFVLPTHSESFGMVVAEALAHGLPVLTTTAAPWSILRERGCGWSVDATVDGITEGLRQATSLDAEALRAMGTKGRTLVVAEVQLETYRGSHALDLRSARKATAGKLRSANRTRRWHDNAVVLLLHLFIRGASWRPFEHSMILLPGTVVEFEAK